jgi:hypothetical protein
MLTRRIESDQQKLQNWILLIIGFKSLSCGVKLSFKKLNRTSLKCHYNSGNSLGGLGVKSLKYVVETDRKLLIRDLVKADIMVSNLTSFRYQHSWDYFPRDGENGQESCCFMLI